VYELAGTRPKMELGKSLVSGPHPLILKISQFIFVDNKLRSDTIQASDKTPAQHRLPMTRYCNRLAFSKNSAGTVSFQVKV